MRKPKEPCYQHIVTATGWYIPKGGLWESECVVCHERFVYLTWSYYGDGAVYTEPVARLEDEWTRVLTEAMVG